MQKPNDEHPDTSEPWKTQVETMALRGELWQLNDITRWLDEATLILCDEAKALVREEVHAHYQDAVNDAVASGMGQREARAHALKTLGHPRAANKR